MGAWNEMCKGCLLYPWELVIVSSPEWRIWRQSLPTQMSDCIILIVPPYHCPFLVSIICMLLDGVGDKVVRFGISAVE